MYLELGRTRVFAAAVDWPGWCRSAKTEELALAALAEYVPRYAIVAKEAGARLPARAGDAFDIVERVAGNVTTDFGAPDKVTKGDAEPLTRAQARRNAALVAASWTVFDRVVAGAPAELRKGPRGGGRDRDKIVGHMVGSAAAYARMIGVRHREPRDAPAVTALREAILEVLRAATAGTPVVERGWPPRYAARRIAWHILDHAWEIEDRIE